ncbi:MAG: efflux RND transporter periplasmic adaptor subunit [Candidatus Taylorbacteria bacterium]|nr:efflux RND transporter periplasmic adaptor subunit [Candidatus Taylorbacteria bacterium]
MKKSPWRHLKNKWLIAAIAIITIVIIVFWLRNGNKTPAFEFTAVTMGNVIETVTVTGTIMPVDKADLAFEKSGVISKINFKVGDKVKKGDILASLKSADDLAALRSTEAQLAEISRGLRPEEFAADQAALDSASTTLANAKRDAVNAVRDGYVKAQSAIVNYADSFFANPQSANPTINILTDSNDQQNKIDLERVVAGEALNSWRDDINNASYSHSGADLLSRIEDHLNVIKAFMSDLSVIVNDLNPGNSGLSQTVINVDVAAMNTGLSVLTQAVNAVAAADTALRSASSAFDQANNQFTLQRAGSSPEAIASQAAKVDQARAIFAKDSIVSPIDGVVTKAGPSLGEFVSAGQSGFAVQNSDFKIEAFVPEADIAKITVGDIASSTLDAYGSYVDFPAQVTMIDPAETVLEGVPTYKVTLRFLNADPRIRSGMTANLEILTHEVDGVLIIPYRAIIDNGGSKSIRLVASDGKSYSSVPVKVGLKGSNGTIELVSGLKEGDKVVTYVK